MTERTPPPDIDEADEIGETDWDNAVELDSPFGEGAEVWGSPCIDFNPAELKLLLAASRLVEEDSIDFIKRASMNRIAEVLTEQSAATPPASG